MSNISHGMNVNQVRTLGTLLDTKAASIDEVITALNSKLGELETGWVGPDASQFRGEWPGYQSQLTAISRSLREYSVKAIRNAEAQTTTSSNL